MYSAESHGDVPRVGDLTVSIDRPYALSKTEKYTPYALHLCPCCRAAILKAWDVRSGQGSLTGRLTLYYLVWDHAGDEGTWSRDNDIPTTKGEYYILAQPALRAVIWHRENQRENLFGQFYESLQLRHRHVN
jgi:hypothetical protein